MPGHLQLFINGFGTVFYHARLAGSGPGVGVYDTPTFHPPAAPTVVTLTQQ